MRGLYVMFLTVGAWLLAGFAFEDVASPTYAEIGLMVGFAVGFFLFVSNIQATDA